MLLYKYARDILNELLNADSAVTITAGEEHRELFGQDYNELSPIEIKTTDEDYEETVNKVNSSFWFELRNGTATGAYRQYYIVKRNNMAMKYPSKSYMALFTQMPDSSGTGYSEPTASDYIRVNLMVGIISGKVTLKTPYTDENTGEAVIENQELIIFPEAFESGWGKIVGFGLFEEETVGMGTPYFWGRLKNYVEATKNHVPLLRAKDFKVTLG